MERERWLTPGVRSLMANIQPKEAAQTLDTGEQLDPIPPTHQKPTVDCSLLHIPSVLSTRVFNVPAFPLGRLLHSLRDPGSSI